MISLDGPSMSESAEDQFVDYVLAVIKLSATWAEAGGVPVAFDRRFVFGENSSWTQPIGMQNNYEQLLNRHRDTLLNMEEAQRCVRKLWSEGILTHLLPSSDRQTSAEALTQEQLQQLGACLLYPIRDMLQRHNTFQPTREQILDSYTRFRDAWTATTVRQTAIIPLLNFRADLQRSITVSKIFEITTFSPEEKGMVWSIVDGFHSWDQLPFHLFLPAEFKIIGSRSLPTLHTLDRDREEAIRELSINHQQMLTELRDIVMALRLLKPGDVAVTAYVEQSDEVPPFHWYPSMGIPGTFLTDFQVRRHGSIYTLLESEAASVSSLVDALDRLSARQHYGGLEIGLRRFNQSYSRNYYEDRIIDLTVALESTLLAGIGSKSELKFRFALHGAALLAHSKAPQESRELLTKMYDARSSIVHGGKFLSELKSRDRLGLEPKDFVQSCEDLVRDILRQFIHELNASAGSTVETVNDALDKRILHGLIPHSQE